MAHLRILSCNLYNGNAEPTALADVLRSTAPDVVAAQELGPNAADVLAHALPYGRLDPALNSTGFGIALRYPADVIPFDMPQRPGLAATLSPVSWPSINYALEIVNVHMANPIERPLGVTRRVRRAQVAAIVGHVARSDQRLVVVGDFNATPIWPAYRRLIRVLRDGVHDTGTTHRTWGPRWWWPRMLRIDHALVRGGVRVTAAQIVGIRGSDHSGLLVDLEVG